MALGIHIFQTPHAALHILALRWYHAGQNGYQKQNKGASAQVGCARIIGSTGMVNTVPGRVHIDLTL